MFLTSWEKLMRHLILIYNNGSKCLYPILLSSYIGFPLSRQFTVTVLNLGLCRLKFRVWSKWREGRRTLTSEIMCDRFRQVYFDILIDSVIIRLIFSNCPRWHQFLYDTFDIKCWVVYPCHDGSSDEIDPFLSYRSVSRSDISSFIK